MLNFKKMRIKKRLTTGFVLVSIITSIASILGVIAMMVISTNYADALVNYGFSQGDIGKALVVFADARSATRGVIGYQDETVIENLTQIHDTKKAAFEEYLAALEKTLTSEEETAFYNSALDSLDDYWAVDTEVISIGATTDDAKSEEAQALAAAKLDPLYESVYGSLSGLMTENVDKGNSLAATLNIMRNTLILAILAIIIISVVVSIKLGSSIAKGISNPLGALAERLRLFSGGDLASPFPTTSTEDEVSDMVHEAGNMAENLNVIINDVSYLLGEMAVGDYAVTTKMEDKYVGDFTAIITALRTMNR